MKKVLIPLAILFTSKSIGQLNKLQSYIDTRNFKSKSLTLSKQFDTLIDVNSSSIVSQPTIDAFFGKNVSTFLTDAGSFTLNKAYAVLDNADKKLFIGSSLKINETNLLTVGVSTGIDAGFATIYSKDGFSNDIGLTIRYNKINSGSIKYEHRQSEAMNIFRKKNLTDLLIPRDIYLSTLSKYFENNKTDSTEILNKELKEAENEVYKEFLKKELEYLENGNYNSSISHWFSFGLTLPITPKQYNNSKDFNSNTFTKKSHYFFETSVSYSWLKKYGKNLSFFQRGSYLFTIELNIKKTNSIETKDIDKYDFNKYLQQGISFDTAFLAKLKTNKVYVGEFKQFWLPSISTRLVWMPINYIGVSGAIQHFYGTLQATNWKLGIPISLKDEEGKSKVNFEFLWQELFKQHTIGISIGLPIGSSIF